jgi:4-hydroxy-4-methyl-2-oxoglutarate aldolase
MNHLVLSKSDLDLLSKYDTPTVCNVIELFNVRPRHKGFMSKRIQACFPELPPMVGYATTATFRAGTPGATSTYSSLEKQVLAFAEVSEPRVVVFQDLDEPTAAATFGEIMCTTYQAFGAVGLVTSGAGRDLVQVRALNFPVFTNGTISSHGYCTIPSVNIAVDVGGVSVRLGELLHGDCNGVTTIPMDIASEVAQACEEFVAAEAVILNYLKSGKVTPKGLGQAQAESQAMTESLRQRLARR